MATLPGAGSVVDFLKSKGFKPATGEQLPLYGQRTQIYNASGLGSKLGDFRGTAEQNTALLNFLSGAEKSSGVNLSPTNITDIISIGKGGATTPAAAGVAATVPTVPRAQSMEEFLTPGSPAAINAAQPAQNTVNTVEQAPQVAQPVIGQETFDAIYDPLKGRNVAQEAIDLFTGSPTFPLAQEATQASKAAVKLNAQRETENFIKNIASRGLYMSGAKNKGVNQIEVDTMSRLLDIDRNFATMVVEGLQKASAEIVKQAQAGAETAIKALDAMGYVLNPLNGQLQLKSSEARAQASEARALETAQKSAENTARQFALQYGVESPFYQIGTTVYRTSDGHAYASQEEFKADTGISIQEAQPLVQNITGGLTTAQRLTLERQQEQDAAKAEKSTTSAKAKYAKVSSGLGFDFEKNGEVITLSEYLEGSGKSLSSALSGSKDSGDLSLLKLINDGVKSPNAEARKAAQEGEAAIRQGVDKLDVIAALEKTYKDLGLDKEARTF